MGMGVLVFVAVGGGVWVGDGVLVGDTAVPVTTTSAITAVAVGVGSGVDCMSVQADNQKALVKMATRMILFMR